MIKRSQILGADFFKQPTLACARALIGTELLWRECSGIVVETEAYLTENDEACHCFWRPSSRAFVARNRAGAAYIYLNYGVHWMLNVLVKGAVEPGLILIRAIEPRSGLELMKKRRGVADERMLCSGPGKLTQALAITDRDHEIDLASGPTRCFRARAEASVEVVADGRIGLSRAADLPWRFTLRESKFISRPVRSGTINHV